MIRAVHIRTASRLHFGLLSLPTTAALSRRYFGGVGLMIDSPGIGLSVEVSDGWSARGPFAERALHFAKMYCDAVGIKTTFRLHVDSATAREHVGLGTGTQLGLAVARALASLTSGTTEPMPADFLAITLAKRVGRGLRSALGIHGFQGGGFLVEGGKTSERAISPLLIRRDFPEDWRIVLVSPLGVVGLHGKRETDAFADLLKNQVADDRTTETLCRLVLLGLVPALVEQDCDAFGEALYEFNRRSGEMFHAIQGGTYAHPHVEAIIKSVRDAGIKGVGQSSWGPTVFILTVAEELSFLCNWLMVKLGIPSEEMVVTSACNHGAGVSAEC